VLHCYIGVGCYFILCTTIILYTDKNEHILFTFIYDDQEGSLSIVVGHSPILLSVIQETFKQDSFYIK